ncbi:MAG: 30S ribosomal protein S13 [Candidatus Pacebacteria bacterium]|nr:30S ribosomal protein S13 [Candidatus Paceibacterota bacterium]
MVRISGVTLPENKQMETALTYIYGIGFPLARKILREAGVDRYKRVKELTPEEIKKIQEIINKNYKVEGELRREVMFSIKRLKEIKCWRGIRHIKGLPVRGQTTRINSRTVRGNVRRTVGSGRKPPPAPK